jgi:hypothetical protein
MFRLTLIFTVFMAATAAPVFAQSNTETARAAFELCMERFPETRETAKLLKQQGWRSEGIAGQFRLYSRNGLRVLAATSTTRSKDQQCFVAVSKLSDTSAFALAKSLSKGIGSRKKITDKDPAIVGGWEGMLNGFKVHIAAFRETDFEVMRGGGVILLRTE